MFKDRLTEAMEAAGVTQTQLARRLGVTQGAVSFWMRGAEPKRPNYLRLLRVLPQMRRLEKEAQAAETSLDVAS